MPPKSTSGAAGEFDVTEPWKKFDPLSLPPFSMNLVAGPSNVGKTVLLTDIMTKLKPRRTIILCCSSECYRTYGFNWPFINLFDTLDDVFKRVYDKLLKHFGRKNTQYSQEVRELVNKVEPAARSKHKKEQEERIERYNQQAKRENWSDEQLEKVIHEFKKEWKAKGKEEQLIRNKHYANVLCKKQEVDTWTAITDDLSNQKKAWEDEIWERDAKAGRQSLRRICHVAQTLLDMQCGNRDQTTTLILYPNMNENCMKNLFKHFLPRGVKNLKQLEEILGYFQNKGWWIVIDRRCVFGKKSASNNPRDFISRYSCGHDLYVDKYIGEPGYVFFHRLHMDYDKAESYVFESGPRLQANAKKAAMMSEVTGKITKKKQAEIDASAELNKKELKDVQKEMVSLVRKIGPAKEVKLMIEIDKHQPIFAQRYENGGNGGDGNGGGFLLSSTLKKKTSSSSSSSTKNKKADTQAEPKSEDDDDDDDDNDIHNRKTAAKKKTSKKEQPTTKSKKEKAIGPDEATEPPSPLLDFDRVDDDSQSSAGSSASSSHAAIATTTATLPSSSGKKKSKS